MVGTYNPSMGIQNGIYSAIALMWQMRKWSKLSNQIDCLTIKQTASTLYFDMETAPLKSFPKLSSSYLKAYPSLSNLNLTELFVKSLSYSNFPLGTSTIRISWHLVWTFSLMTE